MSMTLHFLQTREQAAVHEYVAQLRVALGEALIGLWLFGSKSRGDHSLESDIDLLIVLKDLQPEERWRIRRTAARCSLEYDVLFNTHILDRARWEEEVRYKGTLWREIQRDGVSLMPAAVASGE